jgi:PAS domain S-box-containing protein
MKVSLRLIVIVGSILLVWGTHLIITPSSYIMSERVLTRHMQDIMQNISDLTLEQSYNHLDKARSAASLAKQLLSSNVVTSEIDGTESLERYFFDQLSIYPHLAGIYVGGLNGNFFMVSRHTKHQPDGFRTKIIRHTPQGRTTELIWRDENFTGVEKIQDPGDTYDPRMRPWFKTVMEQKHVAWTDPYIFYTAQKPGVTIAGPIFDRQGNLKGIVGVDIEISELSTFISKLRVGKSGKAFIMNRNGDIIAYHDLDKLVIPTDNRTSFRLPKVNEINDRFTRQAFQSVDWQRDEKENLVLHEPVLASFSSDGKNYLSMFTPFPGDELPWIIGVYIPEDDYLGILKSNRRVTLLITVVISILASLLGLAFAKKITTPVEELAEQAKAIEQHDMKTSFNIRSRFNEIQEAADSFSRMKSSLIGYEKKLKESDTLYRAITKTANDAIIMMDHRFCVSYLNPAAIRMFGYTKKEAVGKKLHKLFAPKRNAPLFRKGLAKFARDGSGPFIDRTVNVIALDKVGTKFPVELSLSSLQIEGNWHAVAIIRDITERKKAEQLRKRLANDLHDGIGGSLTNIKLFAEMTMAHEVDGATRKNLVAIAGISEDCIIEIRNYMNILDDIDPTWEGFLAELHQYCARTLEPHDIGFSMKRDINRNAPPPTRILYINVHKIIKEAITNVIKHSSGDTVTLDVRVAVDRMHCVFSDNGKPGHSTQSRGRGLLSMTARAKELGGILKISWDDGVRIDIHIPFSTTTVHQDEPADETIIIPPEGS